MYLLMRSFTFYPFIRLLIYLLQVFQLFMYATQYFSQGSLSMISPINLIEKHSSRHTLPPIHIEWNMPMRQRSRSYNPRVGRCGAATARIPGEPSSNNLWGHTPPSELPCGSVQRNVTRRTTSPAARSSTRCDSPSSRKSARGCFISDLIQPRLSSPLRQDRM